MTIDTLKLLQHLRDEANRHGNRQMELALCIAIDIEIGARDNALTDMEALKKHLSL